MRHKSSFFLLLILFLMDSAKVLAAEWVVLNAFQHKTGFAIIEVVSEAYLEKLQSMENRGNMMVLSSGSIWLFGHPGDRQFKRLLTRKEFFTIDSIDSRPINLQFTISNKDGIDLESASIVGEVRRDPQDATSVLGEVKITCGSSSECFPRKQSLVDQLNRNLKSYKLLESPSKLRQIDSLMFDPLEGKHYIIDSEVDLSLTHPDDITELKIESLEILEVDSQGNVKFLDIESRVKNHVYKLKRAKDTTTPVKAYYLGDKRVFVEDPPVDGSYDSYMLLRDGSKRMLSGAYQQRDDLIQKFGLGNRYRLANLNPCEQIKKFLLD